MARAQNEKAGKAYELYQSGMKLVEIAKELEIPAGTVRRWKLTYKWGSEPKSERSDKKKTNVQKIGRKQKQMAAHAVEDVMQNNKLTDKQRLFCIYYVRCFNATKAYQRAYGVDYTTAASISYRLLEKDVVRDEIMRLKRNRLNREFFNEEDLFQKYMDIAFADITDFIEFGNESIKVINPDTGEEKEIAVSYVNIKNSDEIDGTLLSGISKGRDGVKVKLADRLRAMQWLSDHMDLATEEQKVRISALKAKTDPDETEYTDDGFLEALNASAGGDWDEEEN